MKSFLTFLKEQIVSAPVLGGAYPKINKSSFLIHAVELKDGSPHRVLCGKVRPEHITDDTTQHNKHDVTCSTCLKRMNKPL
jgi:hypothetical protein